MTDTYNKLQCFSKYLLALILSLICFMVVTHPWNMRLHIPYAYSYYNFNDASLVQIWIKSIIEHGNYLKNPNIGAPNGYNMADFPQAEGFNFLLIKFLTLFSSNSAVVLNLFYIISFPLVMLTTLFVFTRLQIHYIFALIASTLFTFLPFHFSRSYAGHIFLASYYTIPLSIWLAITLTKVTATTISLKKRISQIIGYFFVCILLGSSTVYYAFFGSFFILVSGLIRSIYNRRWLPILKTSLCVILISLTVVANIFYFFTNKATFGTNLNVAARQPADSEYFGMKITSLVFPMPNDRIKAFDKLRNKYEATAPLNTENTLNSLGIMATIGFLFLLIRIIFFKTHKDNDFELISKLNLCGILLGTVGGLGAVFAYTITPMIRCYNRISIYIAFFGIYAVFYSTQLILNKLERTTKFKIFTAFLLLILGMYTQTSTTYIFYKHDIAITKFHNDKNFIKAIENSIPKNSMIFELPYVFFPESNYSYVELIPYLHSSHIKWSNGASYGRAVDRWQRKTSNLSAPLMLDELIHAGFSGIFIERSISELPVNDIENQLARILNLTPLVSEDGNASFYDLKSYAEKLHRMEGDATWNERKTQVRNKLLLDETWGKNFASLESSSNTSWRWCRRHGVLEIVNYGEQPIKLKIYFLAKSTQLAYLKIKTSSFLTKIKIDPEGTPFEKVISISPGINAIYFSMDDKEAALNKDNSNFSIGNFSKTFV